MTALRSALLLLFVCYCRAREDCSSCHDPMYIRIPPCYFYEVESEDDTLVSEETKAPSTFKFTLLPWQRLGYCETAQEGGYVNVGKFRDQLDPSKPLYLELNSQYGVEDYSLSKTTKFTTVEFNYSIYYISIECS